MRRSGTKFRTSGFMYKLKREFADLVLRTVGSSVQYPAMGVALYRWGANAMAQSNSTSDSSLGEESLRRTSAGAEFLSLTVRGKKENL